LTQKDRILKYLRDFGSITPLDAMADLGCMRLASRISELEGEGYAIRKEMEKGRNRYGQKTSYARYSLEQAVKIAV
jgi:hypothetical protein